MRQNLIERHRFNKPPLPMSKIPTLSPSMHSFDSVLNRYPTPPASPPRQSPITHQQPLSQPWSDSLAVLSLQHRMLDRSASEPDHLILSSLSPASSDSPLQSPSAASQQLNSSRYKTEMCRPFEESGYCKYAEKCQFAHGIAELRSLYRHPKYKTELCRTFHTTSFCPYGARCNFIHSEDEAKLHQINNLKQQSSVLSPAGSRPQQLEIGTFDVNIANMQRNTPSLGSTGDSAASSFTDSPTASPTWLDDLVMPTHSPTQLHQQLNQHRPLISSASFPFHNLSKKLSNFAYQWCHWHNQSNQRFESYEHCEAEQWSFWYATITTRLPRWRPHKCAKQSYANHRLCKRHVTRQ